MAANSSDNGSISLSAVLELAGVLHGDGVAGLGLGLSIASLDELLGDTHVVCLGLLVVCVVQR